MGGENPFYPAWDFFSAVSRMPTGRNLLKGAGFIESEHPERIHTDTGTTCKNCAQKSSSRTKNILIVKHAAKLPNLAAFPNPTVNE